MKKIIFTICCLFVLSTLFSQIKKGKQNSIFEDLKVTPGVGIGKLKLGMTESEAIKILKSKPSERTYAEEMKSYLTTGSNFSIDSMIVFVIGFDKALDYPSTLSKVYPIYNMYFKNDSLVYLTISSYSAGVAFAKSVIINNSIRLLDKEKEVLKKMKPYLKVNYAEYNDFVYYKEGIELSFDAKKLTSIGVFKADETYLKKIEDRSEIVKKEYNEMKQLEIKADK